MRSRCTLRSAVLVVLVLGVGGLVCAEDLRVGVYSGAGQEGILAGLAEIKGIRARELKNMGASELSTCDAVVWPHSSLKANDYARPWRVLLDEYVNRGGGLILTHIGAGGFRGVAKDDPLFPQIAVNTDRREFVTIQKADGVDHLIVTNLPATIRHAYYDHMIMKPGPDGRTFYVDEEGNAVVVAGPVGKGRVVIMGNLPGQKGTKTYGPDGLGEVSDEGPTTVRGGELTLLVEAAKWAGETLQAHPISPAELATALEAAVDQAVAKSGAGEEEAVKVFGDAIAGNYLDPNTWDYAKTGPGANKWGTWYGHGIIGPPYDMFLETSAPNQPITTQRFEKSPVKGRFLFTGEAVLSGMFAGVLEWRIIDETANKDIQDGYGIRLVYGGIEERTPGYAFRKDSNEREVKIGEARHAILKITRGTATELATVEDPGRLMSPQEGEKRVPIRFERTAEGTLLFSINGVVVAHVKDSAYNNFIKLRAIMTTPGGRLGFDNPNLVGYFAETEEQYAPTPWIIPEPKEMTQNGETFALADGAQFVVSDRSKIETYLLDEWIIPEIEGRYGITMKAVTLSGMDKSKPAIYLGEGDDPAFAEIFDEDLKSIVSENPGPAPGEGYVIKAEAGKVHAAGAGVRGTFYALQSLVQLLERNEDSVHVRGAYIKDWPDIQLRGPMSGSPRNMRFVNETKWERTERIVHFLARYKVNAIMMGGLYFDFPSYDLTLGDCSWKHLEWTYRLCEKYHIEVIPSGFSLCHTGLHASDFRLSRNNPKLWKWIVDNHVLVKTENIQGQENSFNAMSPEAWQMCKNLNQDYINISPDSRFFISWFDEINPPIHTYAPEGTEDDLLEEWILKIYQHLKENGKRMMMFPSYLTEAAKFPGSSASLGRTGGEGMPVHDVIDRIPKDIIMVDWYYGTSPDRGIYQYLRDKGFDVIAMPGANYGYPYESVYYAAVEGKKAGVMGIFQHGYDFGWYINPTYCNYALPWIYGWSVPEKMKPDWAWQEHWQDVFLGPQPSHTGQVVPLDISAACNESRIDEESDDGKGWLDYGKHSDLRNLPAEEITYRQYRFNIVDEATNNGKSVVVVSGHKGEEASNGGKVTGIPVGSKANGLVFLHAGTSLGKVWPGTNRPCKYRVHYEDGTSGDALISYGHQIGPWIYSADTGHPRLNSIYNDGYLSSCRLVKTGRTALGEKTGLYAYEWVNPHPDKEITSVDLEVSVDRDIRIALVALSAVK